MVKNNLVCTQCGENLPPNVNRLYDEALRAKSGILRLVGCAECGADKADPYIEADGSLLLIDLVLQNTAAFRHVIFNDTSAIYVKAILKMALLTVICDGYIHWRSSLTTLDADDDKSKAGEFFEQEFSFYVSCAKITLAFVTFLAISTFTSAFVDVKKAALGLCMAYSARFCCLAALLWSDNRLMWVFIYLLFFLTTWKVNRVCHRGRLTPAAAFVVSIFAHVGFLLVANFDTILLLNNVND